MEPQIHMTVTRQRLGFAVVLLVLAQSVVAQSASSKTDMEKRVDSLLRQAAMSI